MSATRDNEEMELIFAYKKEKEEANGVDLYLLFKQLEGDSLL